MFERGRRRAARMTRAQDEVRSAPFDLDTRQVQAPILIGASQRSDRVQVMPRNRHAWRGRFDREADDPSGQGRWQTGQSPDIHLDTGAIK